MKILPMHSISYIYKLTVVVLFAFALHSCKKAENNINNNQIVIKPYSVFAVDSNGEMRVSNDGKTWNFIANNGGNAGRAIATSGNNIIWIMRDQDAFVSMGNTNQFNEIKNFGSNPDMSLNQSMILNVPEQDNRIYLAGNSGRGVIYSDTNGKRGSWQVDNAFNAGAPPVRITSFANLGGGKIAAYDYGTNALFIKNNKNAFWNQVGTLNGLPTGGKFFLASFNKKLILADSTGTNGVWYSDNDGNNWSQYQGIPSDAHIMCARSVFGQALLVGTAQYGIFRVTNSNTFTVVNNGLLSGAIIRNITAKDDIYKNDQVAQYVYIATNKGAFRSVDLGENWIQIWDRNIVLIY